MCSLLSVVEDPDPVCRVDRVVSTCPRKVVAVVHVKERKREREHRQIALRS